MTLDSARTAAIPLWLLAAASVSAFAQGDETAPLAVPVAGPPLAARLAAIDAEWKITFDGTARREIPAADLVAWGALPPRTVGPLLVLADGGVLRGEVLELAGETVTADTRWWGEVRLPLDAVRGVVFLPPLDRIAADRLIDRIRRARGSADEVLLENGDAVSGLVTGLKDDQVQLSATAGKASIDVAKVTALIFNPALVRKTRASGLSSLVGFRDGTLLVVARAAVGPGPSQLTLSCGPILSFDPADDPTAAIAYLQPLGGRALYLSHMVPLGYKHVPYLDLPWPYHFDRNALGGALAAGGRVYPKGIGMHSTSRLAFDRPAGYSRFAAELAVDEAAGGRGSVAFRVFLDDGDNAWREAYSSPVVRGGDPPLAISVELGAARRVALVVDFAERGDERDYADWLNARFVTE